MVRDGSGWFGMVRDGSGWFGMVRDGSGRLETAEKLSPEQGRHRKVDLVEIGKLILHRWVCWLVS
jgi:hypothetical protein